jgi:hypothetical protein
VPAACRAGWYARRPFPPSVACATVGSQASTRTAGRLVRSRTAPPRTRRRPTRRNRRVRVGVPRPSAGTTPGAATACSGQRDDHNHRVLADGPHVVHGSQQGLGPRPLVTVVTHDVQVLVAEVPPVSPDVLPATRPLDCETNARALLLLSRNAQIHQRARTGPSGQLLRHVNLPGHGTARGVREVRRTADCLQAQEGGGLAADAGLAGGTLPVGWPGPWDAWRACRRRRSPGIGSAESSSESPALVRRRESERLAPGDVRAEHRFQAIGASRPPRAPGRVVPGAHTWCCSWRGARIEAAS